MEKSSKDVGLEAIRVMYSSRWVQETPSVHGFAFERGIFTRMEIRKPLALTHPGGPEAAWTISKSMRLAEFYRRGMNLHQIHADLLTLSGRYLRNAWMRQEAHSTCLCPFLPVPLLRIVNGGEP